MDEATHQKHSKLLNGIKTVVRVVCGIVGAALIVIGVVVMIAAGTASSFELRVTTGIMGFYCMIFGILIVIAETRTTRTKKLMDYFRFMSTYIGRGVFYIFVGIVVYPISYPSHAIGIIAGILLIVGGVLNLCLFPCFCKIERKTEESKAQPIQDQELYPKGGIEEHHDEEYRPPSYRNSTANPFETGGAVVV